MAANRAWQEQCGFGAECLGKSPKILQGELTDMKKAAAFRKELLGTGSSRMTVTNYSKTGDAFVQRLRAESAGSFYYTEGVVEPDSPLRRACLKTPSLKEQLSVVGLSIALTAYLLYLGFAPAALDLSSAAKPLFVSDFAPEAIPTAACLLMAMAVLALQESTKPMEGSRPRGAPNKAAVQASEAAAGVAAIHCLACVALEASAPGAGSLSFFGLLLLLAPREEDWEAPNDQSRPSSAKRGRREEAEGGVSLLLPRLVPAASLPVAEIVFAVGGCLLFLFLGVGGGLAAWGTPAADGVASLEKFATIGFSGMSEGLFFA